MALHYTEDVQWFRWDAGDYWNLSTVSRLLHFPGGIRGYFYPLLLAPARYLFDLHPSWGFLSYRVYSSAVYAYIFGVVLPEFYGDTFGGRVTFWRRLIVPLLISIIYPDLIVYPLSDLPAACLLLGAIVCTLHSKIHAGKRIAHLALLFCGGILAYGAYNTRTIFLLPVLLVAVAVPLVIYRGKNLRCRLSASAIFLFGACIAATPQLLINGENHKGWTPAVVVTDGDRSLFSAQLLWGIVVQRYETTVDPAAARPELVYPDAAGVKLVNSLNIEPDFTVRDYARLVATHPAAFAGIYVRHMVNGLDVRDGGGYSAVMSPKRDLFAAGNFLVVILGLSIMLAAGILHPVTRADERSRWLWAGVILLPVLMIVPGAVETRFFISLQVAIYSAIAFSGDPGRIVGALRRRGWLIVPALCLAAVLYFTISLDAMAGLEYGTQHVFSVLHDAQARSRMPD